MQKLKKTIFLKKRKGFILTELAIGLLVIGLLFSAISHGTILVEQAKVIMTVGQINNLENAIRMFTIAYELPPGGLQNTLTHFPNAIHNGINSTCIRQGNVKELAAEGTGSYTVKDRSQKRFIPKSISGFNQDLSIWNLTYVSIAMCQLHASKYINEPIASIVNSGVNRGTPHKRNSVGLSPIINQNSRIIIGSYDLNYYITIGRIHTTYNDKSWYGNIKNMGGNLAGNMLKKLALKINNADLNQGNFQSYIADFNYNLVNARKQCDYQSKIPNCMVLYKIFD